MSDNKPDVLGGSTGAVASSVDGKAVCGSACVSAGTCTCDSGQGDGPPRETVTASSGAVWAPQECTLPVVEQPERMAEFDLLFSAAVREVSRPAPTVLHLVLDAAHEAGARDLAARESGCCSFFTFAFTERPDGLHCEITVPDAQAAVLDSLAERAAAVVGVRR